jgi:hypothetical protein
MATRRWKLSILTLCGEYLRAILLLKVRARTPESTPLSPAFGARERCRYMPSPLSKTQKTLLLFFLESEKKLDPIRIMKGLFIFTMEAPLRWMPPDDRYKFVPYSYGPYSREVDRDLNALTLRGYLQTSSAPGRSWSYYSLTQAGKEKAIEVSREFPPPAVTYLQQVREFVQRLSFRQLLDTIYKKYPKYAVNSVFKS